MRTSPRTRLLALVDGGSWPVAVKRMNGWIVSLYKVFGFGVLIALVVGMTSFVSINIYFMLSHGWVVPTILTPQSERVVQSNVNYLEQARQVERLRSDKVAALAALDHVHRAIKLEEEFQASFINALAAEKTRKVARLQRLSSASKELNQVAKGGGGTLGTLGAYRDQEKAVLEQQYAAKLIGQEDLIKGRYLVGQLSTAEVLQREKAWDVTDEAKAVAQEVRAQGELEHILSASLKGGTTHAGQELAAELGQGRINFTMEAVAKEQQYLASEIAKSELSARIAPLESQISSINQALPDQERLLVSLKESPYVRAVKGDVSVAFVPYENLSGVKPGATLRGCYLVFFACKAVGTVRRILDGEVTWRHPLSSRDLRGVMIEMELSDARWAEERALIVNRPPFLI